ncbi:MAG: hypothetical protein R3E08_02295 [Thiotrichaceae bacterium]
MFNVQLIDLKNNMKLSGIHSQKLCLVNILIFILLCSGCGQKGELTRPSAAQAKSATTTVPQKEQEK